MSNVLIQILHAVFLHQNQKTVDADISMKNHQSFWVERKYTYIWVTKNDKKYSENWLEE